MVMSFKELFLFGLVRKIGKHLNFNIENETIIIVSTVLIIIISFFVLYSIYRIIKDAIKKRNVNRD
jgi:hypothetical protein